MVRVITSQAEEPRRRRRKKDQKEAQKYPQMKIYGPNIRYKKNKMITKPM